MKPTKPFRFLSRRWWGPILLLGVVGPALLSPFAADAQSEVPPAPATVLSPYWPWAVARWEPIILEEANRRGLDPDFVAAVIWTESLGRPHTRSPAGAVGLMGIMPREAGFSWRPSAEELEDPATNVSWGTRTLSIVIQQRAGISTGPWPPITGDGNRFTCLDAPPIRRGDAPTLCAGRGPSASAPLPPAYGWRRSLWWTNALATVSQFWAPTSPSPGTVDVRFPSGSPTWV